MINITMYEPQLETITEENNSQVNSDVDDDENESEKIDNSIKEVELTKSEEEEVTPLLKSDDVNEQIDVVINEAVCNFFDEMLKTEEVQHINNMLAREKMIVNFIRKLGWKMKNIHGI